MMKKSTGRSRKKLRTLFMLLFCLAFALTGCSSGIDKGSVAPDFTLTDLDGKSVSLSAYKGKPVFLNFWASWCGPCQDELPDVEKIHQEYQEKGLVVLTVNPGEDKATIKKLMDEKGYTFPVLLDSNKDVARLYNTKDIPVSFFLDKEGKIVTKKVGLMKGDEMRKAVDDLLK